MAGLVHHSTVRYAIIQASSKKDHLDKLVIAYADESCLRDLIAGPSIVGFGFESRDEAMAKLVGSMPDLRALEHKRLSIPSSYEAKQEGDAASVCGIVKIRRNTCHIVQCAVASITILFYSKSLFSVMLRAALGFSS